MLEHRHDIRDEVLALTFDDGPSPWTGSVVLPWDWEWAAERTAGFVIERLRRGSIVCMHDGRPPDEPVELSAPTREATVTAVGMILAAMSERGLRSVTIS